MKLNKSERITLIKGLYAAIEWEKSLIDSYLGVDDSLADAIRKQSNRDIEKYKIIRLKLLAANKKEE